MPAIPGSDQDCVDILAIEKFAKVRVELAVLVVVEAIDELFTGISAGCLDIGDRHASHVGKWQHGFDIVSASGSDADDSELDLLVGAWVGVCGCNRSVG
jgi:hypothetical protein